ITHTTGFISINFISVLDGHGFAGCEWKIAITCIPLLSARLYACRSSAGSMLNVTGDSSLFRIGKILTTLSLWPRRKAQDSFGSASLAIPISCLICAAVREIVFIQFEVTLAAEALGAAAVVVVLLPAAVLLADVPD